MHKQKMEKIFEKSTYMLDRSAYINTTLTFQNETRTSWPLSFIN